MQWKSIVIRNLINTSIQWIWRIPDWRTAGGMHCWSFSPTYRSLRYAIVFKFIVLYCFFTLFRIVYNSYTVRIQFERGYQLADNFQRISVASRESSPWGRRNSGRLVGGEHRALFITKNELSIILIYRFNRIDFPENISRNSAVQMCSNAYKCQSKVHKERKHLRGGALQGIRKRCLPECFQIAMKFSFVEVNHFEQSPRSKLVMKPRGRLLQIARPLSRILLIVFETQSCCSKL